jgi:hypothetical protein
MLVKGKVGKRNLVFRLALAHNQSINRFIIKRRRLTMSPVAFELNATMARDEK